MGHSSEASMTGDSLSRRLLCGKLSLQPSDSVMYGLTTETSIDLANANRILIRSK